MKVPEMHSSSLVFIHIYGIIRMMSRLFFFVKRLSWVMHFPSPPYCQLWKTTLLYLLNPSLCLCCLEKWCGWCAQCASSITKPQMDHFGIHDALSTDRFNWMPTTVYLFKKNSSSDFPFKVVATKFTLPNNDWPSLDCSLVVSFVAHRLMQYFSVLWMLK